MRRIPIFQRLFLTYILCSILPLIIIGGLIYGFSLNFLNRTLEEQTMNSIESFHYELNERVNAYESMIVKIQNRLDIQEALTDEGAGNQDNEVYEIIYEAIAGEAVKPSVHITNLDGSRVYSSSSFPDSYRSGLMSNWGIFREIDSLEQGSSVYVHEINGSFEDRTVITVGAGIDDSSGNRRGYILIEMPRELILEEMRVFNSGLSMHMSIVNEKGYILFDSINNGMEGKFRKASYLDEEKIRNHKPIEKMVGDGTILHLNYMDERLKTFTIVNVSSNIFQAFYRVLQILIFMGSLFSLLISVVLAMVQARSISNPIKDLIRVMGEVERGALDIRADLGCRDEIGDLGKYFNQMLERLNIYMDRVIEKQKKLRTTEIRMLQAQIKPHFIYNTLDVIKWSVKLGQNEETISVVTNLARLLRFSIDSAEEFLTIRSNIEFIDSYLAIQKIKYNNSFQVITDIEDQLMDCKIPRLILQPFIENSIIHGLGKTNRRDGIISITGRVNDCIPSGKEADCIEFRISDNGIGMTEHEIAELSLKRPENHIGIYNVDKRIKMYYGDDYGVSIGSKGDGTEVIIRMPRYREGELL